MTKENVAEAMIIDVSKDSSPHFRVDTFNVPAAVRAEFDAAMKRNLAFIRTLPGFRGHLVLEKARGSSIYNVVTIAMWESEEAIERASGHVRAYYERIGFDPPKSIAAWGITAEIGEYRAADLVTAA